MATLDDLLQEMHAVSAELDRLSETDGRYAGLVERQESIRSRLRSFDYDKYRPPSEVQAELEHLRTLLKRAEADRIDTIRGRFTGADLAVGGKIPATDINRRIDEGNGVADLEARIAHLESVLADG